jgi:hypothetical protein
MPRQAGEGAGTIVSVNGGLLPATELARDGFEWGSEGDGEALAHALLVHEFGREVAERAYQDCARTLIAHFPSTGPNGTAWTLTSAELRAWLDEYESRSNL